MKITVRKLIESVIKERDDKKRHDDISKDYHSIITSVNQILYEFTDINLKIKDSIIKSNKNTDYAGLFAKLSTIVNGPMKIEVNQTTFSVSAKGVKNFIIADPRNNPEAAGALGYYYLGDITIFNSKVANGIYQVAQQFSTDRANMNLHYMRNKNLGLDKFESQLKSLTLEIYNLLTKKAQKIEGLIHHELTHDYDERTPAKSAPGLNIMSADTSNREKLSAKMGGNISNYFADYNNLNTETNAIFFEYLPRFIRDYKKMGKKMNNFIPHVKEVIEKNERLDPANMKKFLSRLYTFLMNTSDERQKEAIGRIEKYKSNKVTKF